MIFKKFFNGLANVADIFHSQRLNNISLRRKENSSEENIAILEGKRVYLLKQQDFFQELNEEVVSLKFIFQLMNNNERG